MELAVPNVPLRQRVDLRIVPDMKTGISEIRFSITENLQVMQVQEMKI
jgi:hypothetical protein